MKETEEYHETSHQLERKRRHEILTAAKKLFYRHGFTGTSMAAIAEQAGISKGLIYHYFSSKEDLLLSFSQEMEVYLEELKQMENPDQALVRFGMDFLVHKVAHYADAPPIQILLTTFANGEINVKKYEAQNPILRDFGREYLGVFFQQGIDRHLYREGDARAFGDIYWSFLMGKLLPVRKGRESEPPDVYIEEIMSLFRR